MKGTRSLVCLDISRIHSPTTTHFPQLPIMLFYPVPIVYQSAQLNQASLWHNPPIWFSREGSRCKHAFKFLSMCRERHRACGSPYSSLNPTHHSLPPIRPVNVHSACRWGQPHFQQSSETQLSPGSSRITPAWSPPWARSTRLRGMLRGGILLNSPEHRAHSQKDTIWLLVEMHS